MNKAIAITLNELVRPVCALLVGFGISIGFFMDKITAEAYLSVAALILGFFFRQRDDNAVRAEEARRVKATRASEARLVKAAQD